jgi:hypothetical protein
VDYIDPASPINEENSGDLDDFEEVTGPESESESRSSHNQEDVLE